MSQARIEAIEICDFRGFPAEAVPPITLSGKSLLLYGENGSGKSTIFDALVQVLDPRERQPYNADLADARCLKHRFSDPASALGRITLTFTDPGVPPLEWRIGTPRPTSHAFWQTMCRTTGLLDYRALLRTHFLHRDKGGINLFPLVVEELLRDIEYPANATKTFGKEWEGIRREGQDWLDLAGRDPAKMDDAEKISYGLTPPEDGDDSTDADGFDEHAAFQEYLKGKRRMLEARIKGFNDALWQRVMQIQSLSNRFIKGETTTKGLDPLVEMDFAFAGKVRTPDSSDVEPWPGEPELVLRARFRGELLDHPGAFLNEARLTAIAVAFYLAAVKVEVPDSVVQTSPEPRLLVLDDVLIGLDMSNRLPVLRLISKHFAAWQTVLMTYDRHWFEVAKRELGDGWVAAELYEDEDDQGQPKPFLVMPSKDPYELARTYFRLKDYPTCANYLRKVCEDALVRFLPECWRRGTPSSSGDITYVRNLGNLHAKLTEYLKDRGCPPCAFPSFAVVKETLLNPLSHADFAVPIYRDELRQAFGLAELLMALCNVVVAETGTEVTVAKDDAAGHRWEYRVCLKQPLRALRVNGVVSFTKCEAHPVEFRKDGVVQSLATETDAPLQRLYDRYCHNRVPAANLYDDFRLPSGRTLEDQRKELLP